MAFFNLLQGSIIGKMGQMCGQKFKRTKYLRSLTFGKAPLTDNQTLAFAKFRWAQECFMGFLTWSVYADKLKPKNMSRLDWLLHVNKPLIRSGPGYAGPIENGSQSGTQLIIDRIRTNESHHNWVVDIHYSGKRPPFTMASAFLSFYDTGGALVYRFERVVAETEYEFGFVVDDIDLSGTQLFMTVGTRDTLAVLLEAYSVPVPYGGA